jgi:hypothetical protein
LLEIPSWKKDFDYGIWERIEELDKGTHLNPHHPI